MPRYWHIYTSQWYTANREQVAFSQIILLCLSRRFTTTIALWSSWAYSVMHEWKQVQHRCLRQGVRAIFHSQILGKDYFGHTVWHNFLTESRNRGMRTHYSSQFFYHKHVLSTPDQHLCAQAELCPGPESCGRHGSGLWRAARQPDGSWVLWVDSRRQVPQDFTHSTGAGLHFERKLLFQHCLQQSWFPGLTPSLHLLQQLLDNT